MGRTRNALVHGLTGLLCFAALASPSDAQTYPTKPIRIVVPSAPGGSNDIVARLLAKTMSIELGQPVLVDNRAGAGGNIGTELAAKSPADGYTVLVVLGNFAINPSLMKQVPYDPIKDFDTIAKLTTYSLFLVAHPSTQARSIPQLVALAKRRPAQLTYGSSGIGGPTHLAGELLNHLAGISTVHVPYKGGAPAMTALLGGEIALSFNGTSVFPHLQSKKLFALGVTGQKRMKAAPDVPTIAEQGVRDYDVTGWHGALVPAGTPSAVIDRWASASRRWLTSADTRDVLESQGLEPDPRMPQEFSQILRAEIQKWGKLIKAAGIKAE